MVAVAASVLLIVAGWDAEWNAAAAKPESADKADEEDDPGESSDRFMN